MGRARRGRLPGELVYEIGVVLPTGLGEGTTKCDERGVLVRVYNVSKLRDLLSQPCRLETVFDAFLFKRRKRVWPALQLALAKGWAVSEQQKKRIGLMDQDLEKKLRKCIDAGLTEAELIKKWNEIKAESGDKQKKGETSGGSAALPGGAEGRGGTSGEKIIIPPEKKDEGFVLFVAQVIALNSSDSSTMERIEAACKDRAELGFMFEGCLYHPYYKGLLIEAKRNKIASLFAHNEAYDFHYLPFHQDWKISDYKQMLGKMNGAVVGRIYRNGERNSLNANKTLHELGVGENARINY